MMVIFNRDIWEEVYQTLSRNKLRTALTAFGVGWGVFMLLIMLGAGNGLEKGVSSEFSGMATNSIFVRSRPTTMPYEGFSKGRWIFFDNSDTEAMKSEIPEIEYVSPGLQLGGWRGANNVKRKDKIGAFEINGYLPNVAKIKLLQMKEGRFLNEIDNKEKRKVVVIGERVKEVLYASDEEVVGSYIQALGINFKVIGSFKSSKSGNSGDAENQSIYIPFSTFQKVFNMGDRVQWYVITSQDNIPASFVDAKVKNLLKLRHKVHPEDPGGVGSFNLEEEFNKVNAVFLGIKGLSWFVGIFTLLAGVIGISNIMLVIIKERSKEIGIRRSIGAKPIHIINQILLEAVVLTVFSGAAGLMLSVVILELLGPVIKDDAFRNPGVDVNIAQTAVFILLISGLLAGLIPAYRAVKIRPVDALRTE